MLWPSTVLSLSRRMPPLELAGDIARSLVLHRRRPPAGLRARVETVAAEATRTRRHFQRWLDPAFAASLGLHDRWQAVQRARDRGGRPAARRGARPAGDRPLAVVFRVHRSGRDAHSRREPISVSRCAARQLPAGDAAASLVHRQAASAPGDARRAAGIRSGLRPKSPLGGDPLCAHLQKARRRAPGSVRADDRSWRASVDRSRVPPLAGGGGDDPWLHIRPLCLNYWLDRASSRATRRGRMTSKPARFERGRPAQETVREPAPRRLWRHPRDSTKRRHDGKDGRRLAAG